MRKCIGCPHYKVRLKCLECEQKAEQKQEIFKPEIITPLKKLSLEGFTDREKTALLLKIVAEISLVRIGQVLRIDRKTTTSLFKKAYHKFRTLKLF